MVKVEKLSENRVKLTVTISVEDFDKALDAAFEKVVKEVKVDGFRPGKMPKSMFINRFGYEALYEEAVNYAIDNSYMQAVAEAKVYPTANPNITLAEGSKIEKGQPFDYVAEVDIWPEVHLGEYKGLEIKKASTRVTAKDVDAYINQELSKKSENVVKEGAAELGDTVVFDFDGSIDGVPFEGGKAENYSLELGSHTFVPGFEDQLVGKTTDEQVDVKVTFPENYHEGLSGKEAVFKCLIHEVKTKQVPTLDDDFVKDLEIANVNTVEEYREYAKEDLKKKKQAEAESKFENDCINAVCEASYAEFPESLIASEVNRQVASLEQQAKQYNVDVTMLLQYMGASSLDDFKKQAEVQVRKQMLHELVFDAIITKENLEATDEEIEAKYAEIAKNYNSTVDALKKQYRNSQIAFQVKYDKALKLIKDSVATK